MKVWKIPQHDEMPSEEMIDWLSEMTQEWDGDESGITICSLDGEHKLGAPGDYVVESDGVYYIVTAAEFAEGELAAPATRNRSSGGFPISQNRT